MSTSNLPPVDDGQRSRPAAASLAEHDGGTVACSCDAQIEVGPFGEILVLRVTGAIDVATIPVVRTALEDALRRSPADLVIDLSGTVFCSMGGFALLAGCARAAEATATVFAVSGLRPHLDRIATMVWPSQCWVRYRSAAAAVSAVRVEQTYRVGRGETAANDALPVE